MLQRIQTVFLLLVCAGMGASLALPLWQKISITTNNQAVLTATSLSHTMSGQIIAESGNIYIAILAIIALGLAAFSITQFKKRSTQMLIGAINSLVMAATIGSMFFSIFKKGMLLFEPTLEGQYLIGFYTAAAALLCNMIANRFIRRDENLVRSADRMR